MSSADGADGNAALLGRLYEQHAEELRRFLTGVVRDPHLAADVVQTVFEKAATLISEEAIASPKAWLFQVAFREALAVRRRDGVKENMLRRMAETQAASDENRPDERLLRAEAGERIRSAVGRLPAPQREVLELRIRENRKFVEIAQQLNVPLGTVLTRMQLALKKLRQTLSDESP